jgi:hypothetical protein
LRDTSADVRRVWRVVRKDAEEAAADPAAAITPEEGRRLGSGTSLGGGGLQAAVGRQLEMRRRLGSWVAGRGEGEQQAAHLAATCRVLSEE